MIGENGLKESVQAGFEGGRIRRSAIAGGGLSVFLFQPSVL